MNAIFANLPLLLGVPEGGATGATGGQPLSMLFTFGAVILIFYFLIIRPQNKKKKETANMLSALKKGDRVATIGGIRGVVQAVKDETIVVRVDDSTKLEFTKSAVSTILAKKESKESKEEEDAEVEEAEAEGDDKE